MEKLRKHFTYIKNGIFIHDLPPDPKNIQQLAKTSLALGLLYWPWPYWTPMALQCEIKYQPDLLYTIHLQTDGCQICYHVWILQVTFELPN